MKWLREYFQMDKRQERGLMVLAIILLLSIAFNHFAPYMFAKSGESLLKSEVYLENLPTESNPAESEKSIKKARKVMLEIDRFFNPNTISLEDLKAMKLPPFVAENWVKYRNSGAVFYHADDVSKIYGLEEDVFAQLKPWIKFEQKQFKKKKTIEKPINENDEKNLDIKKSIQPAIKLGINSADSIELLDVRGIGPFYAGAIVEYRKRLGGFNNINQLMELYKMDSSKFEVMLPQLFLDTVEITKISINNATFKEILYHPYIDYETTKYMINKRNKLGKYAALYQLKDSVHMPDSLFEKILPYIKLDD